MRQELKHLSFLVVMLLTCTILFAQQRTVTGTIVSDDNKEPIVGATVSVKGTDRTTVTDAKGQFSILVSGNESVLRVSNIGFLYKEFAIGSTNTVDVSLAKDVKALDEVIVIGYGTQRA